MPLLARALYVEDARGSGVALVSCDLWSISGGLGDRVSEIVREKIPSLDRDRILLAATHTHHSCGAFATSGMYNFMASSKSGFDPVLFEFLSQRIAASIAEAHASAVDVELSYHVGASQAWSRNRSLVAFRRTPDAAAIRGEAATWTRGPAPRATEAELSVDARVRAVRMTAVTDPERVVAVGVFLATHPTVMPPGTPLYQPDLFGVAADLCERRAPHAGGRRPVFAFFNGAEGDVSPHWGPRGVAETLRLGTMVADDVAEALLRDGVRLEGEVHHGVAVLPLGCREVRGASPWKGEHTAKSAMAGLATLGGAEDGRTHYYKLPWWREGIGVAGGPEGHGRKYPALHLGLPASFPLGPSNLVLAVAPPPREGYLGVYGIGPLLLAGVPGEPTTNVGWSIEKDIRAAGVDGAVLDAVTIGLANEFLSYFTVPSEYACQHYEGASSLFGTYSGEHIRGELASLAESVAQGTDRSALPRRMCYAPGAGKRFGLKDVPCVCSASRLLAILGVEGAAGKPRFRWTETWPTWPPASGDALWPQVVIEMQAGTGWIPLETAEGPEDDTTRRLFVLATSVSRPFRDARWEALWTPPAGLSSGALYRFKVTRTDGHVLTSEPLHLP